ncbi:hypothetical protein EDD85DRAFT_791029 [Armillaria nabsnona]|nr:hypothetical protein EDD85DRAFT_791029 [Armillaria nabsnona]
MSHLAPHENPSTGVPPDEPDLFAFGHILDWTSFLSEDSEGDFEIGIERDPSTPTISTGFYGCHPYLDVGTIEDSIIGVLPILGLYHYAVCLAYSGKQLLWLADRGPLFKSAILADCALKFFKCLYLLWFHKWSTVDEAE